MTLTLRIAITSIALLSIFNANAQNGLSLDGTDDFVQTTYSGVSGNATRTVEAWIKTTANSVRLVIDLSDRVTGMDGDGTETEEIGGTVTRTIETTTKLND
ncbi:MAG: hypothetical protein ACJA1C_000457 [Crocinitomicaceae bacterium]|jgi:hypothetical protein